MPSEYTNIEFPCNSGIRAEYLARAINCALKRLNWQDIFIDEEQGSIVASLKSGEQTLGKRWEFKYRLAARWKVVDGEAAELVISIAETQYAWTQHLCRNKFIELVDLLANDLDDKSQGSSSAAKHAGARFATASELSRADYVSQYVNPAEFLVAPGIESDTVLRVTQSDTNRHAIVCGPTGSGKTTGIFIPNLIERTGASAIVTEATGGNGVPDLYCKTAGFRAAAGHKIYYFNPDDLRSHQINPLDNVNTYRQARRATEIIFQSTTLRTHRGDQSWEMAERQLLTALILHAASQREAGNCNFGYVNHLLDDGPKSLADTLSQSPLLEARRSYTRFIQTCTEGYRNLVINGVMARLDGWNSPRPCKLTERTSLDFDKLQDELFTLYLAVPADNAELKPMMALILNFVLDTIQQRKFKHPLMLMLDEFTNYGAVRNLPSKLTILRHDGIPAVLGVQDYVQLENLYDKEAKLLISQPATRIFFKPNDIDTAQKISQMLGQSDKQWQKLTSSGHLQDKERKEPLLTPSDLLTLGVFDDSNKQPDNASKTMIVFLPSTHPIRTPAFTYQDYLKETDPARYPKPLIKPVHVDESLTFSSPTVAQVDVSAATTEKERQFDSEFSADFEDGY